MFDNDKTLADVRIRIQATGHNFPFRCNVDSGNGTTTTSAFNSVEEAVNHSLRIAELELKWGVEATSVTEESGEL